MKLIMKALEILALITVLLMPTFAGAQTPCLDRKVAKAIVAQNPSLACKDEEPRVSGSILYGGLTGAKVEYSFNGKNESGSTFGADSIELNLRARISKLLSVAIRSEFGKLNNAQ